MISRREKRTKARADRHFNIPRMLNAGMNRRDRKRAQHSFLNTADPIPWRNHVLEYDDVALVDRVARMAQRWDYSGKYLVYPVVGSRAL